MSVNRDYIENAERLLNRAPACNERVRGSGSTIIGPKLEEPRVRTTPDRITHLKPGQIFVFGSNYGGRHSKGAALDARRSFGAVSGVSEGLMGQSYGIPTKPHDVRLRLSVAQIEVHVNNFIDYALLRPELTFLVTEIGCGLAGYTPAEIAPLFRRAVDITNVWLPARFWAVLGSVE